MMYTEEAVKRRSTGLGIKIGNCCGKGGGHGLDVRVRVRSGVALR